MADTKIDAELRTEFGKGAARRLRRDNRVPAVLYGHGTDPLHLSLPGHETMLALKHANALLTLKVNGKRNQLALAKHVQRHPLRGHIEHVDLILVRRGEKVVVEVPVHVVGEAQSGTLINLDHPTISLKAEATHLPEYVEVDVEGMEAGTQVLAKDLVLPEDAELDADEDVLVVHVTMAPTAEELEAETAPEAAEAEAPAPEVEAEAEAAAAEGEGAGEASSDES